MNRDATEGQPDNQPAPGDAPPAAAATSSANPTDPTSPTGTADGTAASSPPVPSAEHIAQLQRERDEYLNLAKSVQAEFDNYQKRAARSRDEERRYALWPLASDLLTAIDNLDRALEAAKANADQAALVQGVAATHNQLLNVLKRHGIEPIQTEPGSPFNPDQHNAVMQQPTTEYPAGSVVAVVQRGFRYHERVLRPSSVIVAKAAEE
jgi:molecular chaperone GrpE